MSDKLEEMKNQFGSAVLGTRALEFIRILQSNPDATLIEAATFAESCDLGELTIGQCFLGKLPKTSKGWTKRLAQPGKKPSGTRKSSTKSSKLKYNVRTSVGREKYDRDVLSYLCDSMQWTAAKEIRDTVGGNEDQARRSLNRLIESGSIEYKGRGPGVRYKAK